MLIFNLFEILANLNFSQSEEKIREGSINYFFEQLSFAYTSKATAVYKILVIHLHLILCSFLFSVSDRSSVKRLSAAAAL